MSLHVFANFVTPYGTANNNRAENEGNITTLQKLLWMGETHSTVSAEAIRFAFRRRLKANGLPCNRHWAEHLSDIPEAVREQLTQAFKDGIKVPCGYFVDSDFAWYSDPKATGFADDDLLGFMSAEAAKEEVEAAGDSATPEPQGDEEKTEEIPEKSGKKKKGKAAKKGTANIRRAVLEVTRAVSITAWPGDVVFSAASPGATPSAQKKGNNPVPYGAEVHTTRYQYGIALTPERLRDKSRTAKAIEALCNLGTVAGNHGRFLFDFSPDAVIFRITPDPAPRLLYCFGTEDEGKTVTADVVVARLKAEDITKDELIFGVSDLDSPLAKQLNEAGIKPLGVKAACAEAVKRINAELKIKG